MAHHHNLTPLLSLIIIVLLLTALTAHAAPQLPPLERESDVAKDIQTIRKNEQDLARLRSKAAQHPHQDVSAYGTKMMRLEATIHRMQAAIWKRDMQQRRAMARDTVTPFYPFAKRNGLKQIDALFELKQILTHHLHLDSSLSIDEHARLNNRILQIMDLIAGEKRILRNELAALKSHLDTYNTASPVRTVVAELVATLGDDTS